MLQEHGVERDPQVWATMRTFVSGSLLLQTYPMDERHWLLGTVYNTGIECLQFVRLSPP